MCIHKVYTAWRIETRIGNSSSRNATITHVCARSIIIKNNTYILYYIRVYDDDQAGDDDAIRITNHHIQF